MGRTHIYAKFPATLEDGVVGLSGGVCWVVCVRRSKPAHAPSTSREKLRAGLRGLTAEGAPVNPPYEFQVWKNNVGIINICIQVCCSA